MTKLSIAGKGILLVALPLVFELVFVAWLSSSLKSAETQIDREIHSQKLIEQTTILMRELVAASFVICFRYLSEQPAQDPSLSKTAVLDTINCLDGLTNGEPSLKELAGQIRTAVETFYESLQRFSEMSPRDLISGDSGKNCLLEIREDMRLIDRSVRKFRYKAAYTHHQLDDDRQSNYKQILLAGVLLSTVLTILLALSFARSISLRLRKLAENTALVSRGAAPQPLLTGSDEVCKLDLVIHSMSEQMQAQEKQRKQLTALLRKKLSEPLADARSTFIKLEEQSNLQAAARKALKKSAQLLDRLVRLLADLSQLEQIEAGQIELNYSDLSSDELINKSIESVQALSAKKNIHLLEEGGSIAFSGDGERLTQILINLLSNAIKFSPENSNIITAASATATQIEFRVKDSGPGIPEELQAKIFEKYEQTKREDATAKGGAGLGLAICAVIAASHQGKLGVDSLVGKGSEFWLRLPRSPQIASSFEDLIPNKAESEKLETIKKEKTGSRSIKFKIWHKGLILVSIPLLFQISFVFFLSSLLDKAQKDTLREIKAISEITIANELFRNATNLAASAGGGYLSGGSDSVDWRGHSREIRNLLEQIDKLYKLNNSNPETKKLVSDIFRSSERLLLTTSKLMLDPPPGKTIGVLGLVRKRVASIQRSLDQFAEKVSRLLNKQQKIANESPELIAATRSEIATVILLAVIASVFLSLLLGLYFSRGISKRIGILIENTIRFTQGREELLPLLKGSDELADFDSDFRSMLSKIHENQEFKKQILAVISHELRTPLTSVSGTVTLLEDGAYGELPGTSAFEIRRAHQDILDVIQLANDLLDIERLEAAKFPMDIKETNLKEAILSALELLKKDRKDLQIEIVSSVSDDASVKADPDLITKAISKLLLFAAGMETETMKIHLGEDDTCYLLTVPDQNQWLSRSDSSRIFEKFQLLDDESENQGKTGSVLALALSKIILAQMNGELMPAPASDTEAAAFLLRIPRQA